MDSPERIHIRAPLLIPALAFSAGITIFYLVQTLWVIVALCASAALAVVLFSIASRNDGRPFPTFMAVIFATLGALSAWVVAPATKESVRGSSLLEGNVTECKTTVNNVAMTVNVDKAIMADGSSTNVSNLNILLYTDGKAVSPGLRIRFPSRLEQPRLMPIFDAERFASAMRRKGILYSVRAEENEIIQTGKASGIRAAASRARDGIETRIWDSGLKSDTKAFLSAILTGERDLLDSDTRQSFADAGIAHILALSGLHLGIIAAMLAGLLMPLDLVINYKWRFVILILLLWGFTGLTGFAPATVRACVMATVFYFSLILERHHSRFNSISAAALAILAANPYDLFNPAFQLSMSCVAAILIFAPLLNPVRRHEHPVLHAFSKTAITSVIAAIGAWMITAYHFGRFSPFSLPLNMLVVPLMTPYLLLSVVYTAILFTGFDPVWLRKLLDWGYSALETASATAESSYIYFSPTAEAAILWSIGILLLAITLYSSLRGWLKFLPATVMLICSTITGIIIQTPREEGIIIAQTYGTTEINYRYGNREGTETYTRGATGFTAHNGNGIAVIQKPSYRLTDSEMLNAARSEIIILAGNFKGSIADIVNPERCSIIIFGPYLRNTTKNRLVKECANYGLRIHSLSSDGPLRLTTHK